MLFIAHAETLSSWKRKGSCSHVCKIKGGERISRKRSLDFFLAKPVLFLFERSWDLQLLSKILLLSVSMIFLPKKMSIGTVCACMTILWDGFHLFLRKRS